MNDNSTPITQQYSKFISKSFVRVILRRFDSYCPVNNNYLLEEPSEVYSIGLWCLSRRKPLPNHEKLRAERVFVRGGRCEPRHRVYIIFIVSNKSSKQRIDLQLANYELAHRFCLRKISEMEQIVLFLRHSIKVIEVFYSQPCLYSS